MTGQFMVPPIARSWPEAVTLIVFLSLLAGTSITITAMVLRHRSLMAGHPGIVATVAASRERR